MDLVKEEAERAIAKHSILNTTASPSMTRQEKLVILAEEFGEVAHELTYDCDGKGLIKELTQLAACCMLWLSSEI